MVVFVFAASCFTYHCCVVPGTTVAFWMICIGTMCNERSDLMVPVRSQVLSPCVYVAEEKPLIEGMKGRLLLRKGKVWNVMKVHECDHFESSSIYIITGNAGAGKTLFSKKLKNLFETQIDAKSCTVFDEFKAKKSLTEIKNWFSKNKSKIVDKKQVGIIELLNLENIDEFLLNLSKLERDIKISILNLMPVGNSYEYLMKNMPQRRLENEYLALTKLDLCDLSILEIAAFIELEHKCMFFSGVPSPKEGLYFAKVGQTADHITQTIESRIG